MKQLLIKDFCRQWPQDIEINKKLVEVRVTVNVYYDDDFDLNCDFENEEEKTRIIRQIERGLLTPVFVQVESHIEGRLFGLSSLGSNLIESKESEIDSILNDHNLVEESLEDAKKAVKEFLKKVG